MKANGKTWLDYINEASRAGYRVEESEEHGGWVYITPKRPRRPSETMAGGFKTSEQAWRAAAGAAFNSAKSR